MPLSLRVEDKIYASYALHGKEVSVDTFEVLVDPENKLQWTPATLDCPPNAYDFLGQRDFRIGRFFVRPDAVYVGRVLIPYRCMFYPFDFKESKTHHFDVLVTK